MPQFSVYKSGLDGICCTRALGVEAAASEILNHNGWASLEELRARIREWGKKARPGQAFQAPYSVIVCDNIEGQTTEECDNCTCDNLNFWDLEPVEDGFIEQLVDCPECKAQWKDRFALVDRIVIKEGE